MKTKIEKEFDAVKFMREQRERVSKKLSKMTNAEILAYFAKKRLEFKIKPNA